VVKVNDVVLDVLNSLDEVAQNSSVVGNFSP
jgi:hypothetical protein